MWLGKNERKGRVLRNACWWGLRGPAVGQSVQTHRPQPHCSRWLCCIADSTLTRFLPPGRATHLWKWPTSTAGLKRTGAAVIRTRVLVTGKTAVLNGVSRCCWQIRFTRPFPNTEHSLSGGTREGGLRLKSRIAKNHKKVNHSHAFNSAF